MSYYTKQFDKDMVEWLREYDKKLDDLWNFLDKRIYPNQIKQAMEGQREIDDLREHIEDLILQIEA